MSKPLPASEAAIVAEFIKGLAFVPDRKLKARVKIIGTKAVRPAYVVKPGVRPLVADNDKSRSLQQHRDRVDAMAENYGLGFDPMTGEELDGIDLDWDVDSDKVRKVDRKQQARDSTARYTPTEWPSERHAADNNNDGLRELTKWMLEANRDDETSEDKGDRRYTIGGFRRMSKPTLSFQH